MGGGRLRGTRGWNRGPWLPYSLNPQIPSLHLGPSTTPQEEQGSEGLYDSGTGMNLWLTI